MKKLTADEEKMLFYAFDFLREERLFNQEDIIILQKKVFFEFMTEEEYTLTYNNYYKAI